VISAPAAAAQAPPLAVPQAAADSKEEKKLVSVSGPSRGAIRTFGEFPPKLKGKFARKVSMRAMLPPELDPTPHCRKVFRFGVAATGTYSITIGSVLGACGGICSIASSKLQPWASSFRINRVVVYPSVGTGVYTFFDWTPSGSSGYVPDTATICNIPDGVSVTGPMRFIPPARSLAGDWINPASFTASTQLVGCTVHIGSVVDLEIEFTLSNVSEATNVTIASGTLGAVYYLALDGPSSNKLIPQGLPTTS